MSHQYFEGTLSDMQATRQRLARLGYRCHEMFETARGTWAFFVY